MAGFAVQWIILKLGGTSLGLWSPLDFAIVVEDLYMAKRSRGAMIHPPGWGTWSLWGIPWFKSKMKKQRTAVGWELLEAVGGEAWRRFHCGQAHCPFRRDALWWAALYLSPSGNFESGAQWCQQEAEILPCYQTEIREEEKVIESKREHRLRFGLKLGRLTHLLIQWLFIELLCASFHSGDSAVGNEDEVLAFLRWHSNMGGKDIICQILDNALKKKKSISTTLKIRILYRSSFKQKKAIKNSEGY